MTLNVLLLAFRKAATSRPLCQGALSIIRNTLPHLWRRTLRNLTKRFLVFLLQNENTKCLLDLAPITLIESCLKFMRATGLLPLGAQPLERIGMRPKVASSWQATTKPFFL